MATSRHILRSLKSKADARRKPTECFADGITKIFGSVVFLVINAFWFLGWIIINTNVIPGIAPFDPFPFGLLTMIVSLQAIFLSIFVLISQNRAGKVADLREEIDLQVDIITEQEITKILQMLTLLFEKHGISTAGDKELQSMLHPTNLEKIESAMEREVNGVSHKDSFPSKRI